VSNVGCQCSTGVLTPPHDPEPNQSDSRPHELPVRVEESRLGGTLQLPDRTRTQERFRRHGRILTARVSVATKACGGRGLVTVPTVPTAVSGIDESAWTPIHYPNAIWDEEQQRLIPDAQVAEVGFTAFTSRRQADHITGRLIVRRVKRLNPTSVPDGQGELFPDYRHHGVFTDSPLTMLQAEKAHRGHAIIEQVIADLKAGALAHLPSASFAANSAWLVLAAIAFNLTRAAGTIASVFHAKATTATIRRQLIAVPARLASSARRLVLHLPTDWPWQAGWDALFGAACGPPTTATT